jgi:hypothetical protein
MPKAKSYEWHLAAGDDIKNDVVATREDRRYSNPGLQPGLR